MTILFIVLAILILLSLIWLFLKKKKNKSLGQQSRQQQSTPTSPNNLGDENGEAVSQPKQARPSTPTPAPKKGIPVRVSGIASGEGGNKKSSVSTSSMASSGEIKRNFIRSSDLK